MIDSTSKQAEESTSLKENTLARPLPLTSWLVRGLGALLCLVLLAAILLPSQWAIKNSHWFDYIFPAALWSSMLLLAIWTGTARRPTSDRRFIAIVLVLFLLSRLAWVLLVPTQPFSDYEEYNKWASIFGQFQPINGDMYRLSINLAMQPWIYPIGLGLLYDIFGHHLIVAELANVVAGTITVLIVYLLAGHLFGSVVARLAAVLFLFWPTQLMYTSVLASEHLAVLLGLSAFVFLMPALREEQNSYRPVIFAGICLGLSFATRYAIVLAVPAAILALLLTRRSFKWKTSHATLLVVAFVITFGLYLGVVAAIWRQVPIPRGGLHLLMGTNAASGGTHINSDTVLYTAHATMAEADQFARAEALRRIQSNPSGFIRLMGDKIVIYWRDDMDGAYFSTEHLYPGGNEPLLKKLQPSLFAASQFFYMSMLIVALLGCIWLVWRGGNAGLIMILSVILGSTLLHSIVVVQTRYHYPSEPLIIILAAFGMVSVSSAALTRFSRVVTLSRHSLTPEKGSPHHLFSGWRKTPVILVAGGALLLISLLALRGSFRINPPNQGQPAQATPIAPPQSKDPTKGSITASPNPIQVCDGSGLGVTNVTYTFPTGRAVEVHIGSPDGPLFARPGASGTSPTAKWVANGMVFVLQDVSDGKSPSTENTLASVTVGVTTEGCK